MLIIKWGLWAFLLMLQQFAHGISSRAKNSRSYMYNTVAALLSNGVWFISNLILVDNFVGILKTSNWGMAAFTGAFYVVFCILGALLSQYAAIKWIEPRFERR